tara:strand:- start:751 stop:1953 length:1203 start_codon:yes stop_codon:yes gene_type:complete
MDLERNKKLLVVFTLGVSLLKWEQQGILLREIEIYKYYRKEGWDITFLTYGDIRERQILEKYFGSQFKLINLRNHLSSKYLLDNQYLNFFYSLKAIFLIQRIRNDIDLIKSSQLYGCWICSIFSILNNKPWLSRIGYDFFKFLDSDISRDRGLLFRSLKIFTLKRLHLYFAKFANKMIVSSKKDFNNTSLWFSKNIILNKNWIYIPSLTTKEIDMKAKNIIESKNLKILFVGRLEYQKRIDIAINAVNKCEPNVFLDIFGSGKEEVSIRNLISNINNNRIRLLGSLDNKSLISKMNNYNVLISTSEIEGSPKSLLEGMGSGLLIICRRCAGNNELIKNGINGFLFNDTNQLKNILNNIKSLNKNQIKDMLSYNYKKVKTEHSLSNFASKEINLANEMISK